MLLLLKYILYLFYKSIILVCIEAIIPDQYEAKLDELTNLLSLAIIRDTMFQML